MSDILFARINSIPILDKKEAAKSILDLDHKFSFWDGYRNIRMFPLMTKDSMTGIEGSSNQRSGEFAWTEFCPEIISKWFEDYVFPWTGQRTRVMALVTQPGASNNEHIDCNRNELNTQQHKFRVVLQGKTNTLYWLTDKGKVNAPDIEEPFIMDGGWPHGMTNTDFLPKVTLALGAPWNGKNSYNDLTILQHRSNFNMPENIEGYWKS